MRLAVFASTNGTDLQAIIDAIQSGELEGVSLEFVLSNKKKCYALERARNAGTLTYFVSVNKGDGEKKTREEYDRECLELCRKHDIDLIFLIGYMRLLSPVLVEAYRNRILNVHPSLLPDFPGMDLDVHRAVIDSGRKVTGCTIHFVDEGTDTGPIVIQREVKIAEGETPESLKIKVQAEEKIAVVEAVKLFRDGRAGMAVGRV